MGKARRLLGLFRSHLPDVYETFHQGGVSPPRYLGEGGLDRLYRRLPTSNISRDLLTRVPGQLAVLPITDVWWSDWGTEERVMKTVERLGRIQELRRRIEEVRSPCALPASA